MIGRRKFLTFLTLFGFAKTRESNTPCAVWPEAKSPCLVPAVSPIPEPDPSEVLQEARKLAASGHFEDALKKHIWYHENSLRIQPAQVGVRLSFALSYWQELGEKYPKARAALLEIQQKNRNSIELGQCDFSVFQEIAGIDRHLGDQSGTVESFRKLREIDATLAAKCYDLAEKALVAQKAYAECLEFLVDPMVNLQRIVNFREKLRNGVATNQAREKAADAIFTERASRLITILAQGGKLADAEKILAAALLTLDNDTIRNAGK
ncbi:hypothetical protein GC170_07830 [bacterium]|nr:hypothetical protein [bacterium]